jgi:hypothetical protein
VIDAKQICADQTRMEGERSTFDALFQDAAQLYLPDHARFGMTGQMTEGTDFNRTIWDGHQIGALARGVSVAQGYTMPQGSMWKDMIADNPDLMKLHHVAVWFEQKSMLRAKRQNEALSGFVGESDKSWASLLALGNQSLSLDIRTDHITKMQVGFLYRSDPVSRVWIDRDHQGMVNRTHRKFEYTAEQALSKWGKNALMRADKVLTCATDDKKKSTKFEFLQCVAPNLHFDADCLDWRCKAYYSSYVSLDDKEMIEEGGYNSLPTIFSGYRRSAFEKYARGPGLDVLPDVKECQELAILIMTAVELGLRPALAAHDDMIDKLINYASGQVTYGAIDRRGDRTVERLLDPAPIVEAANYLAQKHANIDKAFFSDLLQTNQDMKSHVTDSQLYERTAEKGILLGPLSRQEPELWTPLGDREIEIMNALGDFDDMPGEVAEAGGAMQFRYDNPLNRAQKANGAAGYFRVATNVAQMAQLNPKIAEDFEELLPAAGVLEWVAKEVEAVPARLFATEEARKASQDARAQAAQAAALQQALPNLAGAAKDFSQAQSYTNAA